MRDVVPAIQCKGAARVGAAVTPAVIGPRRIVGGVIGVGQLVVLGFGNSPERHLQSAPEADALAFEAAQQIVVKQLVVADLVGRDIAADLFQYRLADRLAQCRVVGTRPDLDHAPRHHFARARAAARGSAVEVDAKSSLEPPEGRGEVKTGIGQLGPAPERLAVPNLLLSPAPRIALKIEIVIENPAQMMRISGTIVFDEARRLDQPNYVRIDFAPIEAIPGDVVKCPAAHVLVLMPANPPASPSRGG